MTLPEYSTTVPTGVYPWKIWRCDLNAGVRLRYAHKPAFVQADPPPSDSDWIIRRYEPVGPTRCSMISYEVDFRCGPDPLPQSCDEYHMRLFRKYCR